MANKIQKFKKLKDSANCVPKTNAKKCGVSPHPIPQEGSSSTNQLIFQSKSYIGIWKLHPSPPLPMLVCNGITIAV